MSDDMKEFQRTLRDFAVNVMRPVGSQLDLTRFRVGS